MYAVCLRLQASAERNYHIFYQLCASRDLPEMRALQLGETGPCSRRRLVHIGDWSTPATAPCRALTTTFVLRRS